MRIRAGIAAAAVALVAAATTGACGADRVTIAPTVPTAMTPTPVLAHSNPSCDGTAVAMPYANFAAVFNAGHADDAADYFGGDHGFVWWDPSDPPGEVHTLDDLSDHFAELHLLHVHLPTSIDPMPPASETPGEGNFVFDDHHGFIGKGSILCQTAKISTFVIDSWTRQIAGLAQVPPPQAGLLGPDSPAPSHRAAPPGSTSWVLLS